MAHSVFNATHHEVFRRDLISIRAHKAVDEIEVILHKKLVRVKGFERPHVSDYLVYNRYFSDTDFKFTPLLVTPSTSPAKLLNKERSVRRAKSKVNDICYNNRFDYFVTLTFAPDKTANRFDLRACMQQFLKIVKAHNRRCDNQWKYVVVPEKHENGAYHLHGFFQNIVEKDLRINKNGYPEIIDFADRCGFTNVRDLSKADDIGYKKMVSYAGKYIVKAMDINEKYRRLYYCSDKLVRSKKVNLPDFDVTQVRNILSQGVKYENDYLIKKRFTTAEFHDTFGKNETLLTYYTKSLCDGGDAIFKKIIKPFDILGNVKNTAKAGLGVAKCVPV